MNKDITLHRGIKLFYQLGVGSIADLNMIYILWDIWCNFSQI